MKVTRWQPDTCECVLEYVWDETIPEDERVLNPVEPVQTCAFHAADYSGEMPHENHYVKVRDENVNKNKVLSSLLKSLPKAQKKEIIDQNGNLNEDFLVQPQWSFTPDRKLQVSHPALDDEQTKTKFKDTVNEQTPGFLELQ